MAETGDLLRVSNLVKTFDRGLFSSGRVRALSDVSLTMGIEPQILAIVGQSGSGKSTLARIILRLETPSSGSIAIDGEELFGRRRAIDPVTLRRKTQAILQNPFEAFSNHLQVEYYLRRTAINLGIAQKRDDVLDVMDRALRQVGLDYARIAGKYLNQFSGGELQRISIARALIPNPKLIVADEPVSMIDASMRMNVVNLFGEIKRSRGVSFIYITHDLSTAYYTADNVIIMNQGRIVEQGSRSEVLDHPRDAYTRELLDSVPRVGRRWPELTSEHASNQIEERTNQEEYHGR